MGNKKLILCLALLFYAQFAFAVDDVFVYLLKYGGEKGTVVYCGITNDPEARALEHAEGGTMGYNTFDTMVVIAGPMSRFQALQQETKCIYEHSIPKLYQTRPRDPNRPSDLNEEERSKKIKEYESSFDISRLRQAQNPRVVYTLEVQRAIEEVLYESSDECDEIPLLCEECECYVTERVFRYSIGNFNGHIFCIHCQSMF